MIPLIVLIIIILCVYGVFIFNFFLNWILILKIKIKESKAWEIYSKVNYIIWFASVVLIPILSSSFLGFESYFKEFWIWFLILGFIFIGLAIRLEIELKKFKNEFEDNSYIIINKGIYRIIRHPSLTKWFLFFMGLSFLFDSYIALFSIPLFLLLFYLQARFLEKYVFFRKFGKKKYQKYKKKTPHLLIPNPYNALIILIAIFVVYVGILNFFL
ncbi:MAG: DUF1295 domain-containing protein [Candidatus Lokiarchaeota archaeon]|nr:DUF1295 domain-containing protein [Candidatus Lokiarchaeota archaeon]